MKISRLEAFSDGVFAILITILVLDFKVPAYHTGYLWEAVLQQWPVLAAYILSFTITLINYPTALLSYTLRQHDRADLRVALVSYAAIAFLISFTFLLMYRYLDRHPELKSRRTQSQVFAVISSDPLRSMTIYLAAIIASFFSITVGAILLVGGIVFHIYAYLHLSHGLNHE